MRQVYPIPREMVDPLTIYDDLDLPAGGERPYVALNMVSTLDGKATVDGRVATIGTDVDHALMRRLRAAGDAVLRGAATVRSNPRFPGVPEDLVPGRRRRGLADQPRMVIVSGSLDLPWDRPFADESPEPPIVLTGRSAPDERVRQAERRGAVVERVGSERVDLAAALALLRDRYGIHRIVCEGGPTLNGAICAEDRVDELFWTVAPKIGGGGHDDLTIVEGPALPEMRRFELVSAFLHEDEWFMRYRRRR